MRPFAATLALVCAGPALAGESPSLAQKIDGAAWVVEVKVSGKGKSITLERVLFPPQADLPKLPPSLRAFSQGSPCWKTVRQTGPVLALVFLKEGKDGALVQQVGVEAERGRYSSLHPAYPQLVEAAAVGATFTEERMRAVDEALLWQKEKAALRSENPYLRALAAEFLEAHGASGVVDEVWGAPGTPERGRNEARSGQPGPASVCPAR